MSGEVTKLLKTNKNKINSLIILQVIFSYILIILSQNLIDSTSENLIRLKNNTGTLYNISDNWFGEEERNFITQPDALNILYTFYNWLNNNDKFEFIAISWQNFYSDAELFPSKFKGGYEYNDISVEELYKSIQANSTFFEHFDIEVIKGRLFTEYDYDFDNAVIPLILGYEYIEYANIGDKIEFDYITSSLIGEVVGFLKEGEFFNNDRGTENLNRYIVMPALEVKSTDRIPSADEISFRIWTYLDHTSGFISTSLSAQEISKIITEKSFELNIIPYSVLGIAPLRFAALGVHGEELGSILTLIAIWTWIVSSLFISLDIASKIQRHKKAIAIYIANGFSYRTVWIGLLPYIFEMNAIGFIVGSLISIVFFGGVYWIVAMAMLINILIQSIYPYVIVKKINIVSAMNGGE